jgi:cation diffusion facilitator family transporter
MQERESIIGKAELIAGLTVVILTVLGVIQVILGEFVSKSVALTANGIDCIGDGFVSGIVWVGLKSFRKPADHKFHYGYYKMENLAAIAAAIVMIVLASFIVYRSYIQFVDPHEIEVPIYGAVIAFIAALIAWALGIKKYMEGKETKMSSVKLDAYNTIKDGTASFMAVIALMLSAYGYPIADAIVGFIIAGIILSIGFATIKESSYILVDACDAECIDHGFVLSAMVEELDAVKAAHIVRLRRTGPVLQGEIEIKVSGDMSVTELHELREEIQGLARKQIPDIERLTVTAIPFEE